MKLINGRGQLGKALSSCRSLFDHDVIVYHTWNFINKDDQTQKLELDKLRLFLESTPSNKKVVFISTSTQTDTPYLTAKRAAEKIVLEHNACNLVLRLPCIIGKGAFSGIRDGSLKPFGEITFTSMNEVCDFICDNIQNSGIIQCPSWTLPARIAKDLILFGKEKS